MGLETSFDVLSAVVERIDSRGQPVRDVEATSTGAGDGTLRARMEVPLSLCPAAGEGTRPVLEPESASPTGSGGLDVRFSMPLLDDIRRTGETAVTVTTHDTRVVDGTIVASLSLTIEPGAGDVTPEPGPDAAGGSASTAAGPVTRPADGDGTTGSNADAHETATRVTDDLTAVRDESVPPYEDTPYLSLLYESCDTFAEMSDLIEMDVAAETVRRYMISAGVHEPSSYDTGPGSGEDDTTSTRARGDVDASGDDPNESGTSAGSGPSSGSVDPGEAVSEEQLVTDGVGLPDGLQLQDVVDAVVSSATVYGVQRELGIGRTETRDLLKKLGLLELVLHRLDGEGDEPVTAERVRACIREYVPTGV